MSKKSVIYLDHAAATPLDPEVLQAMQPYFSERFYNPSAGYLAAQAVRKDLESARRRVAEWLGARSSEIVFTAGGTEANNLSIRGIMEQFSGSNAVVSSIEHESVLEPARRYDSREAAVDAKGVVDVVSLEKLIDKNTVLVSIMYANNEVGSIQPIREVSRLIARLRKERQAKNNPLPLYFHTDACQAANYLDLHVARLGVDLMTLNGGKIYGPKQSGALYVKAGVSLQAQIVGGGQEHDLRSGTENVAAAIGFGRALSLGQESRHQEIKRLQALQQRFFELIKQHLPQATINGSLKQRLPNNVHLTIPGIDNERLLIQLDEAGILAAAGSACSASDEESSHVLKAMGLTEEAARASLRLTMGRGTTEAEIDHTVRMLVKLVA